MSKICILLFLNEFGALVSMALPLQAFAEELRVDTSYLKSLWI